MHYLSFNTYSKLQLYAGSGWHAQTLNPCMTCHIWVSQSLMTRASITPAHGCMAKHVGLCHEGNKLSASRTLSRLASSPPPHLLRPTVDSSSRQPPCRNRTSPLCMLMPACRDEPPARARMRSFHVRKLSVSGGAK